jgi:peptidoglycan/LPS O-acetylase OafA/YrhL
MKDKQIQKKQKIDSLSLFRIFAAILVINFHYAKPFDLPDFLMAGQQMVTFFFVLSGFVLHYSYYDKQNIDYFKFVTSRIEKLAPLYFIGLIFILLLYYFTKRHIDYMALWLNFLFSQSIFPTYCLSFNFPAWFVSTQVFLYLLFLPILKFSNYRSPKSFTLIAIGVWFLTQILLSVMQSAHFNISPKIINDFIFYHPISHLGSFLLGIAVSKIFLSSAKSQNSVWKFLVAIIVVLFFLEFHKIFNSFFGFTLFVGSSLLAPLFACFIMVCAKYANFEVFSHKIIASLGDSSYAIYILHAPIYFLISWFYIFNPKTTHGYFSYLFISIVVGVLAHKFFEQK